MGVCTGTINCLEMPLIMTDLVIGAPTYGVTATKNYHSLGLEFSIKQLSEMKSRGYWLNTSK